MRKGKEKKGGEKEKRGGERGENMKMNPLTRANQRILKADSDNRPSQSDSFIAGLVISPRGVRDVSPPTGSTQYIHFFFKVNRR